METAGESIAVAPVERLLGSAERLSRCGRRALRLRAVGCGVGSAAGVPSAVTGGCASGAAAGDAVTGAGAWAAAGGSPAGGVVGSGAFFFGPCCFAGLEAVGAVFAVCSVTTLTDGGWMAGALGSFFAWPGATWILPSFLASAALAPSGRQQTAATAQTRIARRRIRLRDKR
jgi:hypothetical protein